MGEASIRLFLAGDVMIGRGIDQILVRPSGFELHEPFVRDAREYVRLAKQPSGKVPRGVAFDYIWGDALAEWGRMPLLLAPGTWKPASPLSDQHDRRDDNYSTAA